MLVHFEPHDPRCELGIRAHFIATCYFLNTEAPAFLFIFRLKIKNDFLDLRRTHASQNLFDLRHCYRL